MKIKPKRLIICLLVPLAVGAAAAIISRPSLAAIVDKPPLTPPGWIFPVVWTALYLLMGFASYLVLGSGKPRELVDSAITVYGCQLLVNFFWPILFFRFGLYLFSFFWLAALWLLVIGTVAIFRKLQKTAGLLMIPYLLWVTFAGYLNLGIYILM